MLCVVISDSGLMNGRMYSCCDVVVICSMMSLSVVNVIGSVIVGLC